MYNWIYQNQNNNNIKKSNTTVPETDTTKLFGFLEVHVTSGGKPIENALVTVFILDRFYGEAPVQFATTDVNGTAATLTVPTAYLLSNTVGQDFYFTSYNLRVDALGYYSSQTNNIRFYPGITTIFNINIIPVPLKIPGVNLEQRIQLPPPKFDL